MHILWPDTLILWIHPQSIERMEMFGSPVRSARAFSCGFKDGTLLDDWLWVTYQINNRNALRWRGTVWLNHCFCLGKFESLMTLGESHQNSIKGNIKSQWLNEGRNLLNSSWLENWNARYACVYVICSDSLYLYVNICKVIVIYSFILMYSLIASNYHHEVGSLVLGYSFNCHLANHIHYGICDTIYASVAW